MINLKGHMLFSNGTAEFISLVEAIKATDARTNLMYYPGQQREYKYFDFMSAYKYPSLPWHFTLYTDWAE